MTSRFSEIDRGSVVVMHAVSKRPANSMTDASGAAALPPLQDFTVPTGVPPHRELYRRKDRVSRGALHNVADASSMMGLPTAKSGLEAMFTPTSATHSGGTIVTHIGSSTAAPRIVIPLPAALATATAIATGQVVPTPITAASGTAAAPTAPLPSMLIDTEWFYPQAYPVELIPYLSNGFSFDLKPKTPGEVIEITQEFLRDAYTLRSTVGLDFPVAPGLAKIFSEICKENDDGSPVHPYGESDATRNMYMILAYVMSTQLWTLGFSRPARNYTEVTYPGVIIASYIYRASTYYVDIMNALGLKATEPYLRSGGRARSTDTTVLRLFGGTETLADPKPKMPAIIAIPTITRNLRISADYATGRQSSTTKCSTATYTALQDTALNVKGLADDVATTNVMILIPPKTNPLRQQIMDARCSYYLGLIRKTIKPDDVSAGVPGGDPGIATF